MKFEHVATLKLGPDSNDNCFPSLPIARRFAYLKQYKLLPLGPN